MKGVIILLAVLTICGFIIGAVRGSALDMYVSIWILLACLVFLVVMNHFDELERLEKRKMKWEMMAGNGKRRIRNEKAKD